MATIGTLGTDPDYASLLAGKQNPRLLMAQKLMDLGAAPATNSTQSSFWANLLNQGARGALGGYLYGDEMKREKDEGEKQKAEADAFFKKVGALPPLDAPSPKGGGTAPAPGPRADAGGGDGDPNAGMGVRDRLVARESGGNYGVMNKLRYAGAYQFGSDLLRSNGMYQPTESGEPANTWGGSFSIPGHPNVKTLADFRNTPEAQDTAYKIAMANNDKQLRDAGVYDRAAKIPGVTRDGLLAGAWLGGVHGVSKWVDSGGQSNPGDANGTRIGDYVRMGAGAGPAVAARTPTVARGGQQADASPAPGSAIDALMAGVNAPKPRGVMLAENLLPGTATDSPTAILPDMGGAQGTAVPRAPVSSASLDGPPMPLPPEPPPAEPSPAPAAIVPQPPPAMVPPPQAADVSQPTPAIVPQPDAAVVPAPEAAVVPQPTPAVVPEITAANADPASLANFNGASTPPTPAVVPPPTPAVVPPPAAAVVPPPPQPEPDPAMVAPAGSGETGGQPTIPPPVQGPPVPPGLLARKLLPPVQGPPAPTGGDNASDALNAASLAAARRGENFVPPGAATGPTGPQLAAPLMSWAGNLTPAGAPLLTPTGATGGPTGPQLAGPLVTPAAGPGDAGAPAPGAPAPVPDPSAAGGPNKGAATPASQSQPSSTAGLQDRADQLAALAQEAAGSSNPRIRAYAGVLQAQAAALQRRVDTQTGRDERAADAAERARLAREGRNLPIHEMQGEDGKLHSFQVMPDGTKRDLGLARDQREPTAVHTVKLEGDDGKEHMFIVKPDGTKTDLGPTKGEGGSYGGTGLQQQDSAKLDSLHDKIKNNTATEDEKRQYSRAYNRLRDGTPSEIQDPQNPGRTIKVPGTPTDLTGYAPPPYHDTTVMPGKPPTEGERKNAGYARRMDMANAEIDRLGSRSFGDVLAGKVPMVGNYLTSAEGQQFRTAADAWIMAKLRPESGAVIGKDELQQNFEIYFPMPGDSPARIELKRRLRDLETKNSRLDGGNAYTAEKAAPDGNAALAAARKELGPNATDDAILGRARELMNGR